MSLARERLLPGTADVAEALIDLAPEAVVAVGARLAEPSVLAVPGLRALAARAGGSRAVVAARAGIAEIGEPSH